MSLYRTAAILIVIFTLAHSVPWCTRHDFDLRELLPRNTLTLQQIDVPDGVFVDMVTDTIGSAFFGTLTGQAALGRFLYSDNSGSIEVVPPEILIEAAALPKVTPVYQTSTSQLFMQWSGFCHENGPIDHYQVLVQGAVNEEYNVGLNTTLLVSDLHLKHDDLVAVTVYAKVLPHTSALEGGSAASMLRVDLTAADCPNVATFGKFEYSAQTHAVHARWLRILDREETDIAENADGEAIKYWLAVGTHMDWTAAANFTQVMPKDGSVGFASPYLRLASLYNVTLMANQTYFVTVRSENYAGIHSNCTTLPFVPDLTPPVAGTIQVAPFIDCFSVDVAWHGFYDPESVITNYRVGVGSAALRDDLWPFISTRVRTRAQLSPLTNATSLPQTQVYITVCADSSSLSTCTSVPTNVDCTSPEVSVVFANNAVGLLPGRPWLVQWQEAASEAYPSELQFSLALGTTPRGTQLMPFTNVYANRSMQLPPMTTTPGVTVFASVLVQDRVGRYAISVSQGVTIDDEPPTFVAVPALPSFQTSVVSILHVDCAGTIVGRQSPVVSLTLAAFDVTACRLQVSFVCATVLSVPNGAKNYTASLAYLANGSVPLELLNPLLHNHRYAALVRACNGAGLCSEQFSTVVSIDTTPPVNCTIAHGLPDLSMRSRCIAAGSQQNVSVAFSWNGCVDSESGVALYQAAILNAQTNDVVRPWQQYDASARFALLSVSASANFYRPAIRACNAAGLCAETVASQIEVGASMAAEAICV